MKWSVARAVVEELRRDTRLYLPPLTQRRGFSSCRIEHLLNRLANEVPRNEAYFEVGVLEGRTLEAASFNNIETLCIGCDPCEKYNIVPGDFGSNVLFQRRRWQDATIHKPVGLAFYDGDHSFSATVEFLRNFTGALANEAVVVLDDWDRVTVREAGLTMLDSETYSLIAEMPEYTDGLSTAPHHFGYQFGVAVLGWRRS